MAEKQVLILTSDAGLGHRRAAEAIEAALLELYADQCSVDVVNPIEMADAPKLIQQIESGYDELVIEDPVLYRFSYHAMDAPVISDMMRAITTGMFNDVMLKCIQDTQPDVVLSTYPFYAEPVAKAIEAIKKDIPLAITITDLTDVQSLWYSSVATMHYVPTPSIRDQAYDNNIPATRVRVTGLPVHPEFARETRSKSELREALGWQKDLPTCLIVASARTQQMATISRFLDRAGVRLQVVVVCGGVRDLYAALKQEKWHGPVQVYDWVDNMPQLMKASDFIVTKAGGLIVSESLACGLPVILSEALPGQEAGNVRYIIENEAGAWAPDPAQVLVTAFTWLQGKPPRFKAFQARAQELGKPRAAYDIAKGVWGLA
ncbi:MAG: glycosyltransferase [Anaerolineae bacterium]|nr:glycosyltransferase [Anaerolineae bacterium]